MGLAGSVVGVNGMVRFWGRRFKVKGASAELDRRRRVWDETDGRVRWTVEEKEDGENGEELGKGPVESIVVEYGTQSMEQTMQTDIHQSVRSNQPRQEPAQR